MQEFFPNVGNFRYILVMERNIQFVGQSTAFLDAVERTSRAAPFWSSANAAPARN